ncbi:hypothetical protein P0M11_11465 [Kaistella sp. PBT33-4]|uniref:hypothetical protein n=1 Tax=Kaistella sp. PBT33-4 TaxID=3032000 RepID=UPI0023D7C4FA|nr:hypothetical protein [Kaistella sp. PBT33-4]MDF0720616.1 hypothetical protein [Kaistella sp. PBT33-4]
MMNKPIFSEFFLSKFLYDFKLSAVPNIRRIKHLVESLIKEEKSGKFKSLKEEEVKSRYLTTFFGDILNFNYGNAHTWMFREEKKSITDATKPDAVLGYFYDDKKKDQVRVVIELKDANTNLDDKQKREKNISAVEQGFSYAHKTGGDCKWVVVTNINEIRFYRSHDSSKYQVYLLKDLNNENKLKELLFLFHNDRFMKYDLTERSNTDTLFELSKDQSKTESENLHIIDKIYYSLKRFEEFGFVSPDYLASIKPFNILDEYVWHYHDYKLFTINPEIYNLLRGISVHKKEIVLSHDLQEELGMESVDEAMEKMRWSFKFLNKCMITEIHAVRDYELELAPKKGVLKFPKTHIFNCEPDNIAMADIDLSSEDTFCDCMICNYRNFDFDKLIRKLKQVDGNLDYLNMKYAFGNFLISSNNYRTSYFTLNEIRNLTKVSPEKGVNYFLAALNTTFLYHMIQMSSLEDTEEIRSNIRAIDIDKLLYNELEFYIERDVLDYLKKVKDDDLIDKSLDTVDQLLGQVIALKKLIDGGGSQTGPEYAYNLLLNYEKCFRHHYGNSIFYVKFDKYKKITALTLQALMISYNTAGYGLQYFNDFILTESILHIHSAKLQEILSKQDMIEVDQKSIDKLLLKLNNHLSSYIKNGFFNNFAKNEIVAIQLENWNFGQQYSTIFTNIFTVLSRLDLKKEQFAPLIKTLIGFLDIEDNLAHYNIKELENFMTKRGDLFEEKDLESILNIAIRRDKIHNQKYEGLIRNIPKAFLKHKPQYKYSNINLINRLLLNCQREDGTFKNFRKAINLAQIANDPCKKTLLSAFTDFLNMQFDDEFYKLLLHARVIKFDEADYFEKYLKYVNNRIGYRDFQLESVESINLSFMNFILLISKLKIGFELAFFDKLTGLNTFEMWLLNPKKFDYDLFDSNWLIAVAEYPNFLQSLANIPDLIIAVDLRLQSEFNPSLAEIKYLYLIVRN